MVVLQVDNVTPTYDKVAAFCHRLMVCVCRGSRPLSLKLQPDMDLQAFFLRTVMLAVKKRSRIYEGMLFCLWLTVFTCAISLGTFERVHDDVFLCDSTVENSPVEQLKNVFGVCCLHVYGTSSLLQDYDSLKKTTEMMTPEPSKVAPTTQKPTTTTTEPTTTTTQATTTTTTEEPTTEGATTTTTAEPTTTQVPTTTTTEATTTAMTTTTVKTTTTTTAKPTTTTAKPTTTTVATTTTTKATTTTTVKTTTTTRATTTTTAATTTPDPADTRYSTTSNFHISDLLQAGVPVYKDGPVHSTENGPEGFGSAADFSDNDGSPERSCLKVNDLNAGRAKGSEEHNKCWRNPINCKQGFSASIFAEIIFDRKDESKRYLFSTGGDDEGTPGVAVFYKGIYMHALVSTGENFWSVFVAGLDMNDTWSNVAFTWNQKEGLDLYVNGKRKASAKHPNSGPPPSRQPLKPLQLTVGCRRLGKGSYDDFVRGKLDEFATWQYKVSEENSSYFMGGMDTNKLCKPEKHPLKCSTDMKTLLKEIDTLDLTNVDVAMATIMHVAEVSKANAKKPPSKSTSGSSSESGDDAVSENGGSEEEDLKNIRLNNLKDMIAIVKKLVNKTNGPLSPGVDPEDLSVLYKMQDVMSVIFSESNADLWKELEKEGEDGVALSNSVQDWSLTKLQETKSQNKEVDLLIISDNMATKSIKSSPEEIKKKHQPYLYFPDYGKDPKWQDLRKKWNGASDQLRVPTAIFDDSSEEVDIQSIYYNVFHKMAPSQNSITGGNASNVFLDSRVISFEVKNNYNRDILITDPVIIFLEHYLQKTKSSRRGDSVEEMNEPKIEKWECVKWSDTLEIPDRIKLGGWTTEGCTKINSTEHYTTCSCDDLGMFALLALPPVPKKYVEPEDETWLFAVRGLGYSFSIIVLICYISAIAMRPSLHDQFHIIRLNLSIAAVGTMLAFFSVDFKRHDWESCRVLSGFIHYFYLVVGCWMAILTHALFKGFIRGIVDGRICFYLLFGWGLPLVWVGVVVASSPNYGYEDRCMVGPSKGMRCSLACPLTFISMSCLMWSTVICCNLSAPQIKRLEVVQELNYSTKMLFCLSLVFTGIWIPGFVAWLELDAINLRGWRKAFQIFNSWMGVFIVFFLGFGSKHFRYAVFDKYVKYLNILFHSNEINPTPFEYTNGYRFDYKHYYY